MDNVFNMLPLEVLEMICSYLDTPDVLQLFSIVGGMHELSYPMFRKAQLRSDRYIEPELFMSFSRTTFRDHLTIFDITSIYWIPADDIRRCISTMVNLESLYAIDTKIELSKLDIITYNSLQKLKKLGVSVCNPNLYEGGVQDHVKNYPQLTHLYIHFDYCVGNHLQRILEGFVRQKTVEELWLVEVSMHGDSSIVFGGLPLEELQRFFVSPMMIDDYSLFGSKTKIFSTNFYEERQCYYDKTYVNRGDLSSLGGLEESDWKSLLELCPFNFPQAKALFDGVQISTVKFEEINLVHPMRCNDNHGRLVATVILTENMKNLRKLSLNYCCCLGDRPLLQRIVENSPMVEELELWTCPRVMNNPELLDAAFEPIAKLINLKRLVLNNLPNSINGGFLETVSRNCVYLRSLSISSFRKHNRLHSEVCKMLESATGLKDFRYHVPATSYDNLFESLLKNEELKLRRLYIENRLIETLSEANLRKFVKENPQLQFLQIVGYDKRDKLEMLNSSLEEFRDDGWRYLAVTKEALLYHHQIPLIHYYEIIKHTPRVSSIDTLNDFKR